MKATKRVSSGLLLLFGVGGLAAGSMLEPFMPIVAPILGTVGLIFVIVAPFSYLSERRSRSNRSHGPNEPERVVAVAGTRSGIDQDEVDAKMSVIRLGFRQVNHISIDDEQIENLPEAELERYYRAGLQALRK